MNKKEKIVQAAIDIFCEKGIDKANVSDIVKEANIAQGTFYLYFSSKLAVMPSIAEVMVNKIINELKSEVDSSSIDQQIKQIINVIFNVTNEYKELTMLVYSGLTQTQFIGDWESIYKPLYDWIESLLMSAKKGGLINSTINIKYTAKIIVGAIESSAEQIHIYDREEIDNVKEYKKELEKFLLNGLKI
ncbi:TetR family transcriptional regulator [Staphylococcus sp. 18_1_E_LY]|uniref:TetR family transcriptional regulator n=1 Tax=Staphylococcus lloydii TaxID=2781774 RepID=A0A7T1B263_9STAP|nr:TetR family transcriptional regulator [Staphylococcus lloydii]MBF7027319.1 TetR family transcriptional regulator [Staphylococcus lloydii]QPM76392.1 TetR family transcriptional regulator [Staphylococcus lloydii]